MVQNNILDFELKDVKNDSVKKFSLLEEASMTNLHKSSFQNYDMSKLEVEYDYDTEKEQIKYSKHMLQTDLADAIDWFVTDNPL